MDFDIVSKLFPNALTMLIQLLSTGVIYLLYKNFLHEPVLAYLDKRANYVADELSDAESLKAEAILMKEKSDEEYANAYKEVALLKDKLISDAHKEHQRLLEDSKVEIAALRAQNEKALVLEREQMHKEVYASLLDVATVINEKVLAETHFNEDEMLTALQKEIDQHDNRH